MGKKIRIEMTSARNLLIYVDDILTKEIKMQSNEINSEELFQSLNYEYEIKYDLMPIQEQGSLTDSQYDVLKVFYDLYKDITTEISKIGDKTMTELLPNEK